MNILENIDSQNIEVLKKELIAARKKIVQLEEEMSIITKQHDSDLKELCHGLASPIQIISMGLEHHSEQVTLDQRPSILRMIKATDTLIQTLTEIRKKKLSPMKKSSNNLVA
jgi:hypothetical protein